MGIEPLPPAVQIVRLRRGIFCIFGRFGLCRGLRLRFRQQGKFRHGRHVCLAAEQRAAAQEQRQQLFKAAQANFGKDKGNAVVKSIIEEMGLTSTTGMKMSTYNKVVERLVEICTAHKAELEAEEGTKNDGAAEE